MTFKEKLQKEHPEAVAPWARGGCIGCPSTYGYEKKDRNRCPQTPECWTKENCTTCWNREIPGTEPKFEAFKTRYLCEWPKENPYLTESAKAKIKEKIYLNPRDVELLMSNSQDVLGDVKKELCNAYDLQRFIYETAMITGYEKRPTLKIKKVIFNDPATIVIWYDNTKTVVKCQNGEPYDPEKGLAMAISKRALGNKGNYFDEIKKWTKEYKKTDYQKEERTMEWIYYADNVLHVHEFKCPLCGNIVAQSFDCHCEHIPETCPKCGARNTRQ